MAASPCDAIAERIYEWLDGEMSPAEESEVRQHLALCPSCGRAAQRDAAFLRFLDRRSRVHPAPPALRARVAAMLAAARATAAASNGGGPAGSTAGGAGADPGSESHGASDCPTDRE